MKLKTVLVALAAAALLAGPALAQDVPGRPSGGDPGKQQVDLSKQYGKNAAEARRLMDRARAKREQVLRHFKAESERIARQARAACAAAADGKLTVPSDSAGAAACEQAKQQAKAEFAALMQQTKAELKRIETQLKAALEQLRKK